MGTMNRLFILLTIAAIGLLIGGQTLFSRIPVDQVLQKVRSGMPQSGEVTAGSEESIIPLQQLGGVWVARVEFNDLYDAQLIVDTGATFTTISEDLAFDAGVLIDSTNRHIQLSTAGGRVQAEMGVARRIRVGNVGRDDVQVVVHTIPHLPDGIDGLLGLSFFDRFLVRLDQANRQLHLSPRT